MGDSGETPAKITDGVMFALVKVTDSVMFALVKVTACVMFTLVKVTACYIMGPRVAPGRPVCLLLGVRLG